MNFTYRTHLNTFRGCKPSNSEARLRLPNISSKVGSLKAFLSVEDFRKNVQGLSEEAKFGSEMNLLKKKVHRVFITMNEELSSHSMKKESVGGLNESQVEYESIDERKKLLYDKHAINRQKAAVNICKMIVDEVKQRFSQTVPEEVSEVSSETSNQSLLASTLSASKLIKEAEKCPTLQEKFKKITEVSHNFFYKASMAQSKKKLNHKKDLAPGELEDTVSQESNVHRISKSKDKFPKDELVSTIGDMSELLPEKPYFSTAYKAEFSAIFQQLPKFSPLANSQQYFSILLQKLEITSPVLNRVNRYKRTYVALNRNCISLPDLRIDSGIGQYIAEYFTGYRALIRVDLSGNPIGDKTCALLVHCFLNFSEGLEYLDLSSTNLASYSSKALQIMLKSPSIRLQYLKIENNLIRDEGFCCLAIGLLSNTSLLFLNIGDNSVESPGGIAIGKVLRINRSLKGINFSKSCISGPALREICRSLIINNEILSVSMNGCRLDDEDMKEIGHMMNANCKLQQIILTHNKITQKGLEFLKYGLNKNRKLVHLALSGNKNIKLAGLEKIKETMPKFFEIDIGKESDFFKSAEAKRLMDFI